MTRTTVKMTLLCLVASHALGSIAPDEEVEIVPDTPPTAIEKNIPLDGTAAREILPMENAREEAALRESERNYAELFDRFLNGKLSSIQKVTLKRSCQRRKSPNPFCSLVRQARTLERYVDNRREVKQPPVVPPPEPIAPEIKDNKIVNYKQIKKAKIPSLLKGLAGKSVPELLAVGEAALAEKRCPNPLAVSVAASLEDSLPNPELFLPMARLYEKSGNCAKREPLDREHFLTRAGIFYSLGKDLESAEKALARVTPNDAFAGRSLYWLARVRQKAGKSELADKTYAQLMRRHPFSFHTLVTSFEKKIDLASKYLVSRPVALDKSSRSRQVKETVKQIEILRRHNFIDSSQHVAGWALQRNWKTSATEKLVLASLADANTQVTTMPWLMLRRPELISRESLEIWYPSKFLKVVEKNGNGADPYLLLAIAKKESAFDPNAISIARAQGLMQLNPTTAAKIDPESVPKLLEPETNVQMGSRYVNELLKKLNGNIALVIAAYNAGEEPVFRWKKRYPMDEPILFLDLIPYRETREYVGYVLSNYYWYRRLYQNSGSTDVSSFWAREPSAIDEGLDTHPLPDREP